MRNKNSSTSMLRHESEGVLAWGCKLASELSNLRKDSDLPRDCGLSFREIGSRVGRNQTTVMQVCDRLMQEGTTDRRGRSHPPQCTTSREDRLIGRMAVTDHSVTS
ncbi:transposable element Tcb1 transposase [Trichonephila clavipes]|nr:transposable element Tcb1 transposase [Trichonephila clavipes]